jgi:uncharacterized protein
VVAANSCHGFMSGRREHRGAEPLPHRDFMRALRRTAGVPIGLPATTWMAALGAWGMRTEPELVLKSRRVIARRLTESGFAFQYPECQRGRPTSCSGRERARRVR